MGEMIKVVWRKWYNAPAVAQLEAMGTLPRNEIELDIDFPRDDGASVARAIAEDAHQNDAESFCEGGEIVILEPEDFAGTYRIGVDYEPSFSAWQEDMD